MGLAISDDHKALADVVREFAESSGLRAQTRSALESAADPRPAWKQIAELGWLGLHLPEELGGSGFGLSELAIVAEGLGAGPAPGPFLPTVTAAARDRGRRFTRAAGRAASLAGRRLRLRVPGPRCRRRRGPP